MRNLVCLTAALLVSSAALPAGANAATGSSLAQFTLGISGYVPVICRTSVSESSVMPSTGTVSLGTMQEFCNNSTGYQVIATYSPELANASLIVDGQSIPLQAGGSTVIMQSDKAAIASQQVSLQMPEGVTSGSLSFSIQPL